MNILRVNSSVGVEVTDLHRSVTYSSNLRLNVFTSAAEPETHYASLPSQTDTEDHSV